MTRARARARVLHKSGRNGEKVDRETPSGSEYPRRMRCAKLHLMLPAHQAGRGRGGRTKRTSRRERTKNAERDTDTGRGDRDARCEKRERATGNRDNRGNVAILLIENSSAPSQILIKSRKSLARSIGQTGKVRSVGRFALWQQSLAVRALYTRIFTLRSRSCSVISTSV